MLHAAFSGYHDDCTPPCTVIDFNLCLKFELESKKRILRFMHSKIKYFPSDREEVAEKLGKDALLDVLRKMLLIRNFEVRSEAAYLQGKIGGFFHSYAGQEAIQTALLQAIGPNNWFSASYRCHALALLLGATPKELAAELFGRATGNAKGRGGSMHFYTDRLMGGTGIVGGQIPLGTGAAFALKYREIKDQVSVCVMGDGAVAQGAFHESLNLASLWDLPCIYIIENNHWGMGTAVEKAIAVKLLAEDKAAGYNMKGYTLNGMDFFNCYAGFLSIYQQMLKDSRPVLVEVITDRFKGHSVSDPGLYRTKESLKLLMQGDPILSLRKFLIEQGMLDEDTYKSLDKEMKDTILDAIKFAEESPWPDVSTLGKDVYAP